jgi:hypothetical protein
MLHMVEGELLDDYAVKISGMSARGSGEVQRRAAERCSVEQVQQRVLQSRTIKMD